MAIGIGIFVWYDVLLLFLLGMVFGKKQKMIVVSNKEAKEIPDSKLPVVTVLLPLYKEKATIPYLIESIVKMDYPKDKKDIRFLVENEDNETQISIKTLALEAFKDLMLNMTVTENLSKLEPGLEFQLKLIISVLALKQSLMLLM